MMIDSFVATLKQRYPAGTRIMCDLCTDPYHPIESGATGTVSNVDDIGTVHVRWDNGRGLGLVYGEDSFHVIDGGV